MTKAQNNVIIEKLKIQSKKMFEQYKLIKEMFMAGQIDVNQENAEIFIQNINPGQNSINNNL